MPSLYRGRDRVGADFVNGISSNRASPVRRRERLILLMTVKID
jgi:hypothetical protein